MRDRTELSLQLFQVLIVIIVLLQWAFVVKEPAIDNNNNNNTTTTNSDTLKCEIPTRDKGKHIEDTTKEYPDIQVIETVDTLSTCGWQTVCNVFTSLNRDTYILERRVCFPLYKETCKQSMCCLYQAFCCKFSKTNDMKSSVFICKTRNKSIAFDEHGVSKNVEAVWCYGNRRTYKVDVKQDKEKRIDNFSGPYIISGINQLLIAFLFAILLLKKESDGSMCLKRKYMISDWEKADTRSDFNLMKGEQYTASIWETVFGIRNILTVHITALPFSINQYVDKIVKENKSVEELMNYEWSRYLSFKTFPMDSVMMPMRLSQAGFYYTGHGEEVKCFCCGVTNGDWTTDETAIEVHRRLSPNCKYLGGEETNSIEIHSKEYYNNMFKAPNSSTNSGSPRIDSGATGGPTDTNNHSQYSANSNNNVHKHDNNDMETSSSSTTKPTQAIANTENETSGEVNHTTAGRSKQAATGKSIKTGINMKHPRYAELETRVASFMNWDFLDIQDPVDLANAGFFYAGVKDFVRCYVCGVGLKNWARGDNPWHEHARWSKSCSHLLQHRGYDWSNDISTGNEGSEQTATGEVSHVQKKHNPMDTNAATGHMSEPPSEPNGLDPVAVRALIEMGYSRAVISEAIKTYCGSNGIRSLNAEAIVELILNEESNSNGNESSSSLSERTEASRNNTLPARSSTPPEKHTNQAPGKKESEDARSISEQNRSMREQMMCKICMDRDANVVFLPCGHMVSCHICAVPLRKCAVCRKLIRGSVRVYQS